MNKAIEINLGDEVVILNDMSSVLFVTGAGISVDSNLPTYRGKGGLYTGNEESIERLLSDHNMKHKPSVIWEHIFSGIEAMDSFEPNDAHRAIARMQEVVFRSCLFTQQVDNLHQKSGSINVVDIHGNATQAFCKNCIAVRGVKAAYIPMSEVDFTIKTKKGCPACSFCKSDLRPNIVPFGGELDSNKYNQLLDFILEPVDIAFVIGTSLQFPHIYQPVIELAIAQGTRVVYVDPSKDCKPFALSGIAYHHIGKSATRFFDENVKFLG
ncbi:SIR2 family NAD-dependent protein deacylase [Vibrio splendidus]|nr:Sir2 family NAD-dependent protein deacetylase [Vibrio splendidus]MCC4880685.1 hypothetical protein [Vibrio splendidus]